MYYKQKNQTSITRCKAHNSIRRYFVSVFNSVHTDTLNHKHTRINYALGSLTRTQQPKKLMKSSPQVKIFHHLWNNERGRVLRHGVGRHRRTVEATRRRENDLRWWRHLAEWKIGKTLRTKFWLNFSILEKNFTKWFWFLRKNGVGLSGPTFRAPSRPRCCPPPMALPPSSSLQPWLSVWPRGGTRCCRGWAAGGPPCSWPTGPGRWDRRRWIGGTSTGKKYEEIFSMGTLSKATKD